MFGWYHRVQTRCYEEGTLASRLRIDLNAVGLKVPPQRRIVIASNIWLDASKDRVLCSTLIFVNIGWFVPPLERLERRDVAKRQGGEFVEAYVAKRTKQISPTRALA
ncbi:MAG: hypothetical protein CL920_32125, partial [Deltaproteobacteria bacterium]|nr:hypothetical protein [Deltaproteobacteria bacterium]